MAFAINLVKDIFWLGVLDKDLKVFDVIMETKYGTTYNSYVVRASSGFVLIETVKEKFFQSYLSKLTKIVGDFSQIKYLISNHTEPDHAGSIMKLLQVAPHITVVATRTALGYLKKITNTHFSQKCADDVGSLSMGDKTFEFISVPFLHWPDSMYTYLREANILFTCDSFGSHYSPIHDIRISKLHPEEEDAYQEALLYYYTAIFGPFKQYVLRGLDKIKDLTIDMMCVGHGPILDARIEEITGKYRNWSTVPHKPVDAIKNVVVVYCTAYGYTEEIANAIVSGIKRGENIHVKVRSVNVKNYQEMKTELLVAIANADGVLFGTNTINGDAIPFIWDLALAMNPITHGGKICTAFGSYGWSGEGVTNIINRLKIARMKVLPGFKVQFRPSKTDLDNATEFGRQFADALKTGIVNTVSEKKAPSVNYSELNPTGQVVLWRCTICGDIYAGVVPPEICPACGVSQELFELYVPERPSLISDSQEKFVIIGSSAAGVSAARAIRERAKNCKILIVTNDKHYPYNRPALFDSIKKDLNPSEFYLFPKTYYTDKRIDLKFKSEVTKLDVASRKIVLSTGEQIPYNKLILANGSSNFKPPFPGIDLKGVFSIKFKDEVSELKEYSKGKRNVIVIGGGVLGLEAADALRELGLKVTILEFFTRLMPRQLSLPSSNFLDILLSNSGVTVVLGVQVQTIQGEHGHVKSVITSEAEYPADLVVIASGVRSNIKLAADAGLKVNRGVVVNEKMETSIKGIYAAGDVAEFDQVSMQLWAPAIEQGKVAGANAAGDQLKFKNQIEPLKLIAFNVELFAAGAPPSPSMKGLRTITFKDEKLSQFSSLVFQNEKLIYAAVFNLTHKFPALLNAVRGSYQFSMVMSKFFE